MATKTINALASRGLEIKSLMTQLQNELAGINTKLVRAGAQTIELDAGRVIITEATEARASGTMNLVLDKDRFFQLPPDNAARESALASGIVRIEQGTIAGRASVVQYSLKNK